MSRIDPRDETRLGELLSGVLTSEAEDITPAGDGLSRIQHRVAERRARGWWTRPTLVLGTAAAVALLGVGAYAVAGHLTPGGKAVVSPAVTTTPDSPLPSPTTTTAASPLFPSYALFPFTSAAQVTPSAEQSWMSDPVQVTKHWIEDDLQLPGFDKEVQLSSAANDGVDTVDVTFAVDQAGLAENAAASAVSLVQYDGIWVVIHADDPRGELAIDSPSGGSAVTSPLAVSGKAFGVDETVHAGLYQGGALIGDGTSAGFGNGSGAWSVSVPYGNSKAGTAELVVSLPSAKDGSTATLVAEGVTTATTGAIQPDTFVAIKDGRVDRFDSATGKLLEQIGTSTDAEDPFVDGGGTYYLSGSSSSACANVAGGSTGQYCGTSLHSDLAGQDSVVATPDPGYVITGYTANGGIAWFEALSDPTQASSSKPQGKLYIRGAGAASSVVVPFAVFPPVVVGNPSFEGGGQYLDAFVRTGTSGTIETFDAATGAESRRICAHFNTDQTGMPIGLSDTSANNLTQVTWAQLDSQTGVAVMSCGQQDEAATPHTLFSVSASNAPVGLSAAQDGAVLLELADGAIYTWTAGSGTPHYVTTVAPHPSTDGTPNGVAW